MPGVGFSVQMVGNVNRPSMGFPPYDEVINDYGQAGGDVGPDH